jgi:O-acetyl-ADP-ribose deacetylase (regulator of RNase III)
VRCPTGESRITPGFNLRARYVIHTVGPVWRGGTHGEPALLASCYRSALALARQHRLGAIAFPAISCGIYGYPVDQAAAIAVHETRAAESEFERIILVAFDRRIFDILDRANDPNVSNDPNVPNDPND